MESLSVNHRSVVYHDLKSDGPMDSSFEVPDPSDWLDTPVAQLSTVEAALRCQVCKDFLDTPMITSCSHTFCSLCIRRCITNDGRCPTCRTQEQAIKLRPNSIIQEIVDEFQKARPTVLQLGRDFQATEGDIAQKRKRLKVGGKGFEEAGVIIGTELARRKTRSQTRRPSQSDSSDMDSIDRDAKHNISQAGGCTS